MMNNFEIKTNEAIRFYTIKLLEDRYEEIN